MAIKFLRRRNGLSPSFPWPPSSWAIQMHPGISCKQEHKELSHSPPSFLDSVTKAAAWMVKTARLLRKTFIHRSHHQRQMYPPNITAFLRGSAITPTGMLCSARTAGKKPMRAKSFVGFCVPLGSMNSFQCWKRQSDIRLNSLSQRISSRGQSATPFPSHTDNFTGVEWSW